MSTSITDIAKASGVSTATVSRVINNMPGVRAETSHQVRAAIKSLNYTPQRVRHSPKRQPQVNIRKSLRNGNLGILTLGDSKDLLQTPLMASVLTSISRTAAEYGLGLLIAAQRDMDHPSPLLLERRVDGVIAFMKGSWPLAAHDATLAALTSKVPAVWVMGMGVTSCADHVAPDNIRVGYLALDFLQSHGCKETALLCTTPDWALMRLRCQSFLNAAYDAGLPATAYVVSNNKTHIEAIGRNVVAAESLEELVALIAAAKQRPTGLFITNDLMTSQVYPFLARHDLIPNENVTIISCDNEEARLLGLHPRPASIDTGPEEIGYRTVECLISRIRRPKDPPMMIQVQPRVVEG